MSEQNITLEMNHSELSNRTKVKQVKAIVNSQRTEYELEIKDSNTLTIKSFKSIEGSEHMKERILGVLDNMCENLTSGAGSDCGDLYNCCDCGTDDQEDGCGCRYCFSCNACDFCLTHDFD